MAMLADWRRTQRATLAAAGVVNEHGLVFTRPDGKALHPHSVSQAFERAQRRLDVSPIRFHDLRHTHASLLLRDRVPIKVVSERLGHSNPAFTMTTYQHVLPGMQDDAAAAFGQLLANHSRKLNEDAAAASPVGTGRHPVAAQNGARPPTPRRPCDHTFQLVAGAGFEHCDLRVMKFLPARTTASHAVPVSWAFALPHALTVPPRITPSLRKV